MSESTSNLDPDKSDQCKPEESASSERWSRERAAEVVAAWRKSGQRMSVWCREHDIPAHRVHYWRNQLAPGGDSLVAQHAGFIPVVKAVGSSSQALKIVLHGDVTVEVCADCDMGLLQSVVEALR